MKKRMVWLIVAVAAFGLPALAEVVITSPTGLPDESDVVLEKTVDAVRDIPVDTVAVADDIISYIGDEIRNTAHGVKSEFQGEEPREDIREDMLQDVAKAWDPAGEILFRYYQVSPVIIQAMELKGVQTGAFLDLQEFFGGVDFPAGASASLQKEYGKLIVRNTAANLQRIESILGTYVQAEEDYKQVEINAKFIEVSQSTLDQLGFTWRIEDTGGITGVRLFDDWKLDAPQDVLKAGLRGATAAFGGDIGVGSMVLTKGGWMPLSVTINALEQATDSDVLSSPSLTTKAGKKAEIWVGEQRQVPTAFDVNSSEVNVHVQHTDWDSQLMGVYFSVTPEILADNIIRLDLKPKIVDLLGYDTYKVSPEASMLMIQGSASGFRVSGRFPILNAPAAGISTAWNEMKATLAPLYGYDEDYYSDPNYFHRRDGTEDLDKEWSSSEPYYGYSSSHRRAQHDEFGIKLAPNDGSLPYFRIREIETTVDVADGSTVGLGGLIYDRLETYKDKVPVLGSIPLVGRLFRSEGERSIKRNLMIFVTATQVGDNGMRKSDVTLNN